MAHLFLGFADREARSTFLRESPMVPLFVCSKLHIRTPLSYLCGHLCGSIERNQNLEPQRTQRISAKFAEKNQIRTLPARQIFSTFPATPIYNAQLIES